MSKAEGSGGVEATAGAPRPAQAALGLTPEEAERAASRFVPLWQLDEAPFAPNSGLSDEELHALAGSGTAASAVQQAAAPVLGAPTTTSVDEGWGTPAPSPAGVAEAAEVPPPAREPAREPAPEPAREPAPGPAPEPQGAPAAAAIAAEALASVIVEAPTPPPAAVAPPPATPPPAVVPPPAVPPPAVAPPPVAAAKPAAAGKSTLVGMAPPATRAHLEAKTDPGVRNRPRAQVPTVPDDVSLERFTKSSARKRMPLFLGLGAAVLIIGVYFVSTAVSAPEPAPTSRTSAVPPTENPANENAAAHNVPPPPPVAEAPPAPPPPTKAATPAAPPTPPSWAAVSPASPAPPAPPPPRVAQPAPPPATPHPPPPRTPRPAPPKNPSSAPASGGIVRDNPF